MPGNFLSNKTIETNNIKSFSQITLSLSRNIFLQIGWYNIREVARQIRCQPADLLHSCKMDKIQVMSDRLLYFLNLPL